MTAIGTAGRLRTLLTPGIRLQITLWYASVFAVLLLLVSVVSYADTSASLNANVNSTLALRARQIAAGISNQNGRLIIEDVSGALPGLGVSPSSSEPQSNDSDNDDSGSGSDDDHPAVVPSVDTGAVVRILDSGGTLIYTSPAAKKLPNNSSAAIRALSGAAWFDTVTAATGEPVRVYSLPLQQGGQVYGLVQVGASLVSTNSTLHSLLLGWLLIAPVVLLLGALGSFWLARRAFIPVSRLTRIARQVEAGDLRQRVPVPRPQDEVRELALTLNDMISRLESAFSRQRRFVADASHELRTPVSAIRSMTDVALLNEKSPAQYIGVLWGINAEAERLGRLIGDLLVLARADEEHIPLERAPLRLDQVAQDVASVSSVLADERGIELRVETAGSVVVLADADRILQAMLNLVHNALMYTPPARGGIVTLRVWSEAENAVLSVSDTGIGIEAKHLPHIFERFYRAAPEHVHSAGGSGLGLAIVDWVVRAHNGQVSVDSRVGVGSTFTVRLPLAMSVARLPENRTSPVGKIAAFNGTLINRT